jgi:hypothetical protein
MHWRSIDQLVTTVFPSINKKHYFALGGFLWSIWLTTILSAFHFMSCPKAGNYPQMETLVCA